MIKHFISGIFLGLILLSCKVEKQESLGNYLNPGSLPMIKNSKMYQISSYDTTGGNNDRINIPAGKTAEIVNIKGPGIITRIWVTIDSRDPHYLRRILLRIYWDGEKEPSVEVPVGDFFGSGFEYKHHTPQYIGMSSGGYYSYFPMPFNKSARIEVVNETGEEIYAFYYQVNYHKLEDPLPENTAYFHAQWRRNIRTDYEGNYVALDAEGEGHFVGLNFSGQSYNKSLFYLEGDEMIYVDGEDFPSTHGTGLEDYFTSGWYFKNGEFTAPYHGLVMMDSLGRITAYRHHIKDAIPFDKSIKVTLEHGHGNEQIADFSTTAFWYQEEPHKTFEPIKKAGLRIPLQRPVPNGAIEAEDLDISGRVERKIVNMSDYGSDWSGRKQLMVDGQPNQTFNIAIPNAFEKEYNITAYLTQGPEYGNLSISYKDKEIASFEGYNSQIKAAKAVKLPDIVPENKTIPLKFTITGKSEDASGYKVGLDAFHLTPVRTYIPEWYIIGPFPNPRESDYLRYGLDSVYAPEREINLQASYEGAGGQQISWERISGEKGGYGMELWKHFDPYEFIIAYAFTYVYSLVAQTVPFLIGSDDGAKVFLNDEEIYRFLEIRIAAPDQDRLELHLKPGWNKLMVKAENNFGGFAFYARIIDINDNIKYSIDRKLSGNE